MTPKKTLRQREIELRSRLATAAGLAELEDLATRYAAAGGGPRPEGRSLITYILVYERVRGLLAG